MKTVYLNTPAAGTWARDCELISFNFDDKGLRINYHRDEDDTYWTMYCNTCTAYKLIAEELSTRGYLINLPFDGAFYEILDSPWLTELEVTGSRILTGCRHFVLKFYDEAIEIIAKKLEFEQLQKKPIEIKE